MNQMVPIMDVPIHNVTMEEATDTVIDFLSSNKSHTVFTPNPEIIMEAQKDKELMECLKTANLVVPDGIGVVIASRLLGGQRLPERVGGFDLMQNVLDRIKDTKIRVYFLGSKPGVARQAAKNMEKKHPGLQIVGTRDGYFKPDEERELIDEIKRLKVDLLLVGLGAPRQEKWISDHIEELGVKVAAGVGGSLDVMAGVVKRAPEIYQKLNLEWFYRLITNPKRAKRMLNLPIFGCKIIFLSLRTKYQK